MGKTKEQSAALTRKAELIWGDKKYVLPSPLDEFAGKTNLIDIGDVWDIGIVVSEPFPSGRTRPPGAPDGAAGPAAPPYHETAAAYTRYEQLQPDNLSDLVTTSKASA